MKPENPTSPSKMRFIDPHIHMSARTTDDYENLRKAGVVAVIEPAFWLGQTRTSVHSFRDYFSSLVGWERFRASQFGIKHYCAIGLNSKEANNDVLAEQVIELLPRYICKEGVVALGEIGFDEMTALEEKYFQLQLEIARDLRIPIMIHTPHRDKKRGTLRSMDLIREQGIEEGRVVIDHNTEETVRDVLDRGYWSAFTLYPRTKMGSQRMVEIVKQYGSTRIFADSSADWGVSDPLAVPKTANLMLSQGLSPLDVEKVCYTNALEVYRQSGQIDESDWEEQMGIDLSTLYEGNSVLRGQDPLSEGKLIT